MILANDFQRQWEDIGPELVEAFTAVGRSGWYVLGDEVRRFETELARYWKMEEAVGVASGMDAVEIGLRLLGCGPGDKVLTSPISAFATVLAIVRTGAAPVFPDCDSHGLLDLDQCEDILRIDKGIRFMAPVHLYGFAIDSGRLAALRDRFELGVLEDCAQSIGASWRQPGSQEVLSGAAGQLAATSFYPTKNLGGLGDGGALLTRSPELASKARMMRDYGQTAKYKHEAIGFNSRLDELQAALLRRVMLPRLPAWTRRRRETAAKYLRTIQNDRLLLPLPDPHCEPVWHLFPVHVRNGDKPGFLEHLRHKGVCAGEHYPQVLADQPAMANIQMEAPCGLDRSRAFCASEVSLPIHPYLTEDEVNHVAESCNSWK